MPDSDLSTPRWAVRIRQDGKIVGAGILLSTDRVLTSAHVVSEEMEIIAEFVGAPGSEVHQVTARVEEYVEETQDADGDPSGDVALLSLEHPRPPDDPVRLYRVSARNRKVSMYGFPDGNNGGMWLRATIDGGVGRDGQVQLSPVGSSQQASPGYSGSGVLDDVTDEVIGMVLSGSHDRCRNRSSFMTPAEVIVRHIPEVAQWTGGKRAVDDGLRSTGGDASEVLHDKLFAQRLENWFRGDGQQVKISVVPADNAARAAALRLAITGADRELRVQASLDRASRHTPGTAPSAGSHDLAVNASQYTFAKIAERIAERMGLRQRSVDSVVERVRAAGVALTLVFVGVDEVDDPPALLHLLEVLRAEGNRLLLVFRTAGDLYERSHHELVVKPRERRARLVKRLEEITGPLAGALYKLMTVVRLQNASAVEADLVSVHTALADLARAEDGSGHVVRDLDLARYERLAERVASRVAEAISALGRLRDRRDELRGRLQSYQVLYQRCTRGEEDLEMDGLHLRAYRLLTDRPCDVSAAETATDAYVRRVEYWIGQNPCQGGDSSS